MPKGTTLNSELLAFCTVNGQFAVLVLKDHMIHISSHFLSGCSHKHAHNVRHVITGL